MSRAQVALLPDGRRLHLQDGPIDLIVAAFGAPEAVQAAYRAAAARFETILDELCAELRLLREPAMPGGTSLSGAVARRMYDAVAPFAADGFITPMAAVAGAVAEEVLGAMTGAAPLARAYVNNGGDIALHLGPGARFGVGMIDRPDRPSLFGTVEIASGDPVRGIATSGRRGRSFSLGIADAVTILATSAAEADAAATLVANAVDVEDPAITRLPATALDPDSDLGGRLVTTAVGSLGEAAIATALDNGAGYAQTLVERRLIRAAMLVLKGQARIVGGLREGIGCSS